MSKPAAKRSADIGAGQEVLNHIGSVIDAGGRREGGTDRRAQDRDPGARQPGLNARVAWYVVDVSSIAAAPESCIARVAGPAPRCDTVKAADHRDLHRGRSAFQQAQVATGGQRRPAGCAAPSPGSWSQGPSVILPRLGREPVRSAGSHLLVGAPALINGFLRQQPQALGFGRIGELPCNRSGSTVISRSRGTAGSDGWSMCLCSIARHPPSGAWRRGPERHDHHVEEVHCAIPRDATPRPGQRKCRAAANQSSEPAPIASIVTSLSLVSGLAADFLQAARTSAPM
jgi:hypothetical protein